jgi:PAS domain S-box-containing protein
LIKKSAYLIRNELILLIFHPERLVDVAAGESALLDQDRQPQVSEIESLYRDMFDHAIWGIFQTTEDGRYITANPALARIYGYDTPAELLAALTDISRQLYVDPRRRDQFIHLMQQNGRLSAFESQVYRSDGAVIWIAESCREVRTSGGSLLYYEGTVEEITARKHAEHELLAAKEAAEAANRAKSDFLAAISHELRTPLNAVIGFAEIIRGELLGPVGTPEYRDYADDIHESGRHLLELISDILDFIAAESGNLRIELAEVDLDDLARRTIRMLQSQADQRQLAVTFWPGAAAAVVVGDERRLLQILLNLVGNALKFTPSPGRVDVAIDDTDAATIAITVRDTGIGIAESDIERVRQPFQQVDGKLARKHEGTGLGLTICDRLVRLHGGSLTLESAVGAGTTVRATLPRHAPRAPGDDPDTAAPGAT